MGATEDSDNEDPQLAARAVVVDKDLFLVVTDANGYWYFPGGRLQSGEGFRECAVRETFEETGIRVRVGDVIAVHDIGGSLGVRKIELFFSGAVLSGPSGREWSDIDGTVSEVRWCTPNEIEELDVRPAQIVPHFLSGKRNGAALYESGWVS